MATQSNSELHEQPKAIKSVNAVPSRRRQWWRCTIGKHDWKPIKNARWFDEYTWNSCNYCTSERLVKNPVHYFNGYPIEKDDKGRLVARCHFGFWVVAEHVPQERAKRRK